MATQEYKHVAYRGALARGQSVQNVDKHIPQLGALNDTTAAAGGADIKTVVLMRHKGH
jgi:hypothetical protein